MHQPIDRRRGRHLIAKDPIPVREDQIARDEDGASLVAFGEEREENLGLFGTLLDVAHIDVLGFVPCDRVGGELLFNLITDRYERRATVVTTNLAFAEWVTVFAGDEKLTTALLDRLAHHATVLTMKGKSYRMRKRRAQEAHS